MALVGVCFAVRMHRYLCDEPEADLAPDLVPAYLELLEAISQLSLAAQGEHPQYQAVLDASQYNDVSRQQMYPAIML